MELKSALNGLNMTMDRDFGIVNGNVRRLAMRPTTNLAVTYLGGVAPQQQQQHAVAGGDRAMMLATLMPTPQDEFSSPLAGV
jgi:hypothetical protein